MPEYSNTTALGVPIIFVSRIEKLFGPGHKPQYPIKAM